MLSVKMCGSCPMAASAVAHLRTYAPIPPGRASGNSKVRNAIRMARVMLHNYGESARSVPAGAGNARNQDGIHAGGKSDPDDLEYLANLCRGTLWGRAEKSPGDFAGSGDGFWDFVAGDPDRPARCRATRETHYHRSPSDQRLEPMRPN